MDVEKRVLYEDNHLLVVEKPVNIPTQADASRDDDLLTLCKQYIKRKYNKPGDVYLGLVHRLDRPVGGAIAFARTSKAAARLSAQIKDGRFAREYLAITQGLTAQGGTLEHWLLKSASTNTTRTVAEGTHGAKRASLEYTRISATEGMSLLRVKLHTGRSHQIRVQLSSSGFPIWGDARYGNGRPGEQIALFAYFLELDHPTKGEKLQFKLELPKVYPWGLFPGEGYGL